MGERDTVMRLRRWEPAGERYGLGQGRFRAADAAGTGGGRAGYGQSKIFISVGYVSVYRRFYGDRSVRQAVQPVSVRKISKMVITVDFSLPCEEC